MKRHFQLCLLLLLCSPLVNAQNNPGSPTAIQRIADIGRLWGVIHYFHPIAGKGNLNTDSLIIRHIDTLIAHPDETHFTTTVKNIFAQLGDPTSGIVEKLPPTTQLARTTTYCTTLASGECYLAIPQDAFRQNEEPADLLKAHIEKNQSFIIDLRNTSINNQLGVKQYTNFVQPLVAGLVTNTLTLPTPRSVYYHGLIRQDFPGDLNILPLDKNANINDHYQVYYGLRNMAEGVYLQATPQAVYTNKHYCFIVNRFVNVNTLKALLALRQRNACRLIIEGEIPDYAYGEFYSMKLSDNLTAKIKTAECIYEDGTTGTGPDVSLTWQQDTSLQSTLIRTAAKLLKQDIPSPAIRVPENTVFIRKSQFDYPADSVPTPALRLLGLFNFWNAIHYFSPNKHLIPHNWDSVLTSYIPIFLSAQTKQDYFLALLKLTASIKDGHSILISKQGGRTPFNIMDGNLPIGTELIGDNVYITGVLEDSAQQTTLASIREGDQLLAIDGIPVKQIAQQWEPYIVASNKAGFNREFYFTWLTNGTVGSNALITVKQQGKIKKLTLRRIKRDDYYNLRGKLNRLPVVPPYCKILKGNIGYLRINRIYSEELDSLSNILKGCNSIILDARGYPRDWRLGSQLAAYIATKTDTVSLDKFPFIISPDLHKNFTIIQYGIITPNNNPNLKHKKYFLLADEGNQSQGEGNIIAIQGVTNATTIGTPTAGANGMAITINFPGQYFSFFSGFGEYYPDNTPNQQLGVKLDVAVPKTLKGILQGQDEILDKAIELATRQHGR